MQVCDAGAFIAAERGDRAMWTRLKAALTVGEPPVTSAAVIGQVWRGSARQARTARLLDTVEALPLTERAGRAAGVLLGRAGASDVVDAALVLAAADGDSIYTSDPGDIANLARAHGLHVDIVPV
ncbi:MAG: hypothetical protein LBG60_13965 [Bifidobacteriaceae bacterium]|jgi:predicted nucleic acid-binding protein|nr:hypothetical protein [Bifidobacteriaceae bacterium]